MANKHDSVRLNLPERFDLKYIGSDGEAHRPYMIHRALFGSLERFFGILTEHYAGGFPVWLAPEQVRVLPLTEDQHDFADEVASTLQKADIRTSIDKKQTKLNAKIKNAQLEKIPYMLIIGKDEVAEQKVALRHRLKGMMGAQTIDEFIEHLQTEDKERTT